MYQTQLLKIRIRPGKTDQVIEFLSNLSQRKAESLEALRREGMMIETMFLERREEADYLYYYVKARDLGHATEINMQATDPLTLEIRRFVSETWGDVASPEPLLDLDLIPESQGEPAKPMARRRGKSTPQDANSIANPVSKAVPAPAAPGAPHALAGG